MALVVGLADTCRKKLIQVADMISELIGVLTWNRSTECRAAGQPCFSPVDDAVTQQSRRNAMIPHFSDSVDL